MFPTLFRSVEWLGQAFAVLAEPAGGFAPKLRCTLPSASVERGGLCNGSKYAKFAAGQFGFSPLRMSVVGCSVLPNLLIIGEFVSPGGAFRLAVHCRDQIHGQRC